MVNTLRNPCTFGLFCGIFAAAAVSVLQAVPQLSHQYVTQQMRNTLQTPVRIAMLPANLALHIAVKVTAGHALQLHKVNFGAVFVGDH